MAMDENPTVKEGQSWSSWADIVGFRNSENEEEEEDAGKEKNWKKRRENDAMKLRKEEMGLFGYCPTWDDFFLVVCELCGRVVKPQAFSGHLECRHGNSSCHSSRETTVSSSNPQPQPHHHGSNKNSSGGSGGHTSSHGSAPNPPSQQQRSGANSTVPLVPSSSGNRSNSSGSIYSNQSSAKSSPNQSNTLNNSQSAGSNTKISNTRTNTNHHNSMSSNNNQSSKLSSSRQISASSNNPSANSNTKSSTARQNSSSSSNTRQNLTPSNNQNSKPSARSSNPVPISNANASSSGNNTPEHSNTGKSKSDPKSDSKSSKKNHAIIDPVVRVERMPSSVVMKKTTTDSPSSVNSGDRRERSASPQVITTESNANLDLEHVRASPARNQVLYEGTSGPGPGNLESSQNLGVGQRKIAQSSKSDSSTKKTNVGTGSGANLREGHAGTMSAPAMGAVNRKPSKSKKASKERKQLLCKDREYDANKHCGVVTAESGKHCTRSLTCKTHSLSLRRAVIGRKKHFDELLSEHRAAKESQLKNPVSQAPATAPRANPQPSASHNSDLEKIGSSKGNPSAAIVNLKRVLASGRVSKTAQVAGAPPTSTSTHNPPIQRLPSCRVTSDSGNSGSHASGNSDASKSPNLDKNHSVQRSDLPYLSHHPRPAAMCSFGIRRLGCGVFLTNRYLDATRSALEMAFLHHKGNQVPPKKLCADASSLLPLHDPLMETNDPYSFTRLDLSGVNESEGSSLASPPIYTDIKPISSNNSVINSATTSSAKTNTSILPNNKLPGNATSPNSATQSLAELNTSAVKRTSNKSKLANAVNKLKRLKSCEEKNTSNCGSSPTSEPISPQTPSAAKKRRTSVNSNPNNPSNSNLPISNRQVPPAAGAQTLTLTALTSANLRNNSAMAAHQSSRSIPLSFPLTIGERLGALSRLNVTSSPFVNRNNVAIAPAILRNNLSGVPNHGSSSPLKDNVFLTGVDVINGQIPVTSALLHSVTVSRASDSAPTTLLATPPGIALGHNSLVNQLSRFQQNLTSNNSPHQCDLTTNSNKPGANSASGGAKGNKCKSRKSSRSNSGAQLQSQQQNSSRGVYGSPLNLGLSLLLDGGPGAISSAHVSSSSVGLQLSSGSSPSDGSSPQLRMESLSPGMSSPTVNGRGPSPCGNLPPLFTPSKNTFGSGTVTSTTISGLNVRLSPASRTNTPSPDSLSTNHFSQHLTKGKSKHVSSYPKPVTPLNVVAAAAQHHSNLSFPVTPPVGSSAANAANITYQQVFASQMLTQAQLNQFQAFHSPTAVPSKNNKNIASKSNSVAAGSIPLKLLAATSSASSQGTQHRHLLLSDDSRRKDLQQDSHSLST